MGGESPKPASTPTGAVFLSYASEDAAAAERIALALRAAGVEVWFDREELRGGDAWDRRIREQIHGCRLFVAVISVHTEARDEGYFRREWKLAVDRTHDMDERKAFLVPVAIDATRERGAHVPEKFHELQWSRLPDGQMLPAFIDRVQRLLLPVQSDAPATDRRSTHTAASATPAREAVPPWNRKRVLPLLGGVMAAAALGYIVVENFVSSRQSAPPTPPVAPAAQQTAPRAGTLSAFSPPPHSIAVLPFVNMSGDKDQEYFSDGLAEELLNALARINELQVSARTSSFSFKGKDADIGTIARKLNVGAILEGSVRRSGRKVRVTAQLNNAVTGFHMWSQTYDRDLGDVLRLETEIAGAVAGTLKITLLGDTAARIEMGGTVTPAAFDAYLRGIHLVSKQDNAENWLGAIAAYTEAIRLDPGYANAYAFRSYAYNFYAANWATGTEVQAGLQKAGADARRALALAPDLALAHWVLAEFYISTLELQRADDEYARVRALAPNDFLSGYGAFAIQTGRTEAGLAALRKAIELDPLTAGPLEGYGYAHYFARQYEEAARAYRRTLILEPDDIGTHSLLGLAYYALGNFEAARSSCEHDSEDVDTLVCLAVTYRKLGHIQDADSTFAKFMKLRGDADAYAYAEIYAQWGDRAEALRWLDTAVRLRDTGLILLKTDPLMDPLRKEPRFQAIERELKFPS
jgi:TolB-like protein/Tfp pilus assembly protein PilF